MDFRKGFDGRNYAGGLLEAGLGMDVEQRLDGGPMVKAEHYISSLVDRTGVQDMTTLIEDKLQQVFEDYEGGAVGLPSGILSVDEVRIPSGVILLSIDGYGATTLKQRTNQHATTTSGTSTGGNTASTLNDTGKNFTTLLDSEIQYTLEITSGPLLGQVRVIQSYTATQLTTDVPFGSTPGSVTYSVHEPKALVSLDATDAEFSGLIGVRLDGNKANQKAHNDAIRLVNTVGGPTLLDSHHILRDVLVLDPKGNGLSIGRNVREARVENVKCYRAGRYGKLTLFEGGTDNWYINCTWAQCGLFGFIANGDNDHILSNKCFGNGVDNISGNAGGFHVSRPCFLVNPDTQENRGPGLHVLNTHNVVAVGISMDANGGAGVLIDNSFDCFIDGSVRSTAGLLYQTTWALHNVNGSDRNHVTLNFRSAELLGGAVEPTSFFGVDNRFELNSRLYGRSYSVGREPEVAAEDHFTVGKQDSPATGNPSYSWTTDISAVPKSLFVGNDGTSTKAFITMDFENSRLTLGDTGIVVNLMGAVSFNSHLIAATDNTYDIGASGANRFRDLFLSRNATIGGELTSVLTGVNQTAYIVKNSLGNNIARFYSNASNQGEFALRDHLGANQIVLSGSGNAEFLGTVTTGGVSGQILMVGAGTNNWGGNIALGVENGNGIIVGKINTANNTNRVLTLIRGDTNGTELYGFKGDGVTVGFQFIANGASTLAGSLAVSGTATFNGAVFVTDDTLVVGREVLSVWGTDGSTNNEHFRFGKTGCGVAGNPYYVWSTSNEAVADAIFSSWDGTSAWTFIRADHSAQSITLGDSGGVTVYVGDAIAVAGNFAINTNKFTVTASSGNTLVAGTLNVTGGSTFAAIGATTGTFSSSISATTGTFSTSVSAPNGSFTTGLSVNFGGTQYGLTRDGSGFVMAV